MELELERNDSMVSDLSFILPEDEIDRFPVDDLKPPLAATSTEQERKTIEFEPFEPLPKKKPGNSFISNWVKRLAKPKGDTKKAKPITEPVKHRMVTDVHELAYHGMSIDLDMPSDYSSTAPPMIPGNSGIQLHVASDEMVHLEKGLKSEINSLGYPSIGNSDRDMLEFEQHMFMDLDQNCINDLIEDALKSEAKAPYKRSKLMVVGEGRAGKTCTIRSLMNQVFNNDETSTKGFEVKRVNAKHWQQDDNQGFLIEQLADVIKANKDAEEREVLTPGTPLDPRKGSSQPGVDTGKESAEQPRTQSNKKIALDKEEVKRYGKDLMFSENPTDSLSFTIWDFGGQEVFYSMHHLFLTEYGCYLLVFNGLLLLDEERKQTCIEYLKFWLFSKKIHAPSAPIMLVATHTESFRAEDMQEAHKVLNSHVFVSNSFNEVYNGKFNFFAIDNRTSIGIIMLRNVIEDVVRKQEYIKKSIPISFLRVIEMLLEKEEAYLSINEAREVVLKCGLADDLFEVALEFLSQRGLITFFNEHESLRRFVILQPQWLISAITDVVYDEELHDDPDFDAEYSRDFRKFLNSRVLSKALLNNIWSKKGFNDDLQDFLIQVMCKSSLMCPYAFANTPSFFVPSLFTANISSAPLKDGESEYTGPSFVIDFSGEYSTVILKDDGNVFVRYMPYGFFERMVCLCIDHCAVFSDSMKPNIESRRAQLSFGLEIDFEMSVEKNDQGDPLWIKFATLNDTEMEDAIKLVQKVFSMVRALKDDFFTKNKKDAELAVSLLIPSTDDDKAIYADYEELFAIFQSSRKQRFVRPNKVKNKKVKVELYSRWFEASDENGQIFNLLIPERTNASLKKLLSSKMVVPTKSVLLLPETLQHHCFLSYKQSSAIDIVGKQFYILSNKGYKCWYDQQHRGAINLESMVEGVKKSMCYILFLSKDIFPSPYVEAEVTTALNMNKPILFLHHPDTGRSGYWDFGDYIKNAPEIVKPLFADIESIQLQRRYYLEEAVTVELDRKLRTIYAKTMKSML